MHVDTDATTRSAAPSARPRPARWIVESSWALAAAVASVAAAAGALGVTPAVLTERWTTGGDDQILHYMLFRSATQAFPFTENGLLGFPSGFNAFFTAQFDVASAVVAGALALVIRDGFLLLNVFYLLTFAGVAITGYAFFRCLRTPAWTAALVATVFSLAPYHFLRIGAGHAFLANYWAVPLLGILVLVVAGERTDPFRAWRSRAGTRRGRLLRGAVPVVVLPVLIASTGGYYYVFGILVIGGVWLLCGIASLASRESIRAVLQRFLPLGVLCAVVGVELLLLGADWGERYAPYFEDRGVGESEIFAGKILSLLLPWQGTEIPKIGALTNIYANATAVATTTEPPGLPVIAILGLCLLLVALPVVGAVGEQGLRATALGRFLADGRIRVLAIATLWTLLFFVISGLGMAVAVFLGPTVRAWSRLSIVIALLALGAVAIALGRIDRRWLRGVAVAVVAVVVLLDQLLGVSRMVPLGATADDEMTSLVAAADDALPDGCGVIQLPIKSFPDSGRVGAMGDYDEGLPYLYTEGSDLAWSYGAIRGTSGYDVLEEAGTPEGLAALVESSGACAVYVDTAAYVDDEGAWIDDVLAVSGSLEPIAQSTTGRWLVFAAQG